MLTLLNIVWPVALGIVMAALVLAAFIYVRFVNILSTRYPDVWKSLGCPRLFLHNTLHNSISMGRFLSARDYLSLDDDDLHRLGNLLLSLRQVGGLANLVWLVAFLLLLVFG